MTFFTATLTAGYSLPLIKMNLPPELVEHIFHHRERAQNQFSSKSDTVVDQLQEWKKSAAETVRDSANETISGKFGIKQISKPRLWFGLQISNPFSLMRSTTGTSFRFALS